MIDIIFHILIVLYEFVSSFIYIYLLKVKIRK